MFERFTHKARAVVSTAQEEARRARVRYIGTEHLLAAMIAIGDGRAHDALRTAGVTLEFVRAETARLTSAPGPLGDEDADALKSIGIDLGAVVESVERSFGAGALSEAGRERPRSGHIPLTKRAKKVLELALREAVRLDHDYIGTEHLLLGLIRERDGMGMKVLANAGVDTTALRDAMLVDIQNTPGGARLRFGIFAAEGRMGMMARDVIHRAVEESKRRDQHHLGTEHILAALADVGTGPAYAVLIRFGLTADGIRAAIADEGSTRFEWRRNKGRPRFRPAVRKVLEAASREATRMGAAQIGTEHLLLGILGETDGPAADILRQAGVSVPEMRAQLTEGMGEAA